MVFLYKTFVRIYFDKNMINDLMNELKSFNVSYRFAEKGSNDVNNDYYYLFINIKSIEELSKFIDENDCYVILGKKRKIKEIDFPIIEVLDDKIRKDNQLNK